VAIVLHALNACLLWKLVSKLQRWITQDSSERTTSPSKMSSLNINNKLSSSINWDNGCFVGVMIWSIHPLRVETVCWMSCLPYINALFFALLAFHMLILINEMDRTGGDGGGGGGGDADDEEVINDGEVVSNDKVQIRLKKRTIVKRNGSSVNQGGLLPNNVRKFLFVVLFTLFYLCSVLSKAAALPMLGVYLVFQFFLASSSSSSSSSSSTTTTAQQIWKLLLRPFTHYFMGCVVVALYGAQKAIWANNIGMKITEEHPQNALKVNGRGG
jgi:hypothetical protein